MKEVKVGVIGGSGLYEVKGIEDLKEIRVNTPFGEPSDTIVLGTLEGVRIAFLPRHARGHRLTPSEVPSRANIYALKSLGVEWIISVSAVGSLREDIHPLDIVIPDQLIDRTKGRDSSFFGRGIVVHIPFARPFCPVLSDILYRASLEEGVRVHKGGTYIVIEGPQFSTKAESNLYRSWGASIIGMTALPEAKLAREAEICYATIACVTDYDCWYEGEEEVSAEMIISNLRRNIERAQGILRRALTLLPPKRECECASALKTAIVTAPHLIDPKLKRELHLLIGKYLS